MSSVGLQYPPACSRPTRPQWQAAIRLASVFAASRRDAPMRGMRLIGGGTPRRYLRTQFIAHQQNPTLWAALPFDPILHRSRSAGAAPSMRSAYIPKIGSLVQVGVGGSLPANLSGTPLAFSAVTSAVVAWQTQCRCRPPLCIPLRSARR